MSWKTTPIVILLLCMIFVVVPSNAFGQNQLPEPVTIDIDLAQFVAHQHVDKYYPSLEWHLIDHMILYDIYGSVNAYAFIFALSDSNFNSKDDLRRHIQDKSAILEQAREDQAILKSETDSTEKARARVVEAEEALYDFQNFATIITGATNDSKIILRHFRGIPDFWVNAETLIETPIVRQVDNKQENRRIVMITPMDFRLIITERAKKEALTTNEQTTRRAAFLDTEKVYRPRSNKAQSLGEIKREHQDLENRRMQKLNSLEPAERAKYEKALRSRVKALSDKWQNYREIQMNEQNNSEVLR